MIARTDTKAFAEEWIAAFNAHDLERILSHYEEDVTLVSPRVALIIGDESGVVRGKAALRDYFGRALARVPDLHFALDEIYTGVESMVLRYRTGDGRKAAELMVFGAEGRVREVRAHYAAA